jgi:hypothetical protein
MAVQRSPARNEVQWKESIATATPNTQLLSQQSSVRHFSMKSALHVTTIILQRPIVRIRQPRRRRDDVILTSDSREK